MITISINDRYYFNECGNAFIPNVKELIEYYQLDSRIYATKEPFPYEGYGVYGCGVSYPTKEAAEKAAEKIILSIAENYRKGAKICSAK